MSISPSLLQSFFDTFLSDDIDGIMQLMDPNCEWVIMATGETFRGTDEVRRLAQRSVAARLHTKETHMEVTNQFTSEDQFCLEYIHHYIVTDQWPSSGKRPPAGTQGDVKICLVCHVKDGKFDRIHEYFDLGQVTSPETIRHLYS
jgi:ketosteroid isomerase-like protein